MLEPCHEDILRLGPEIVKELKRLIRFEKAICWLPSSEDERFPNIDMPKRQRERAEKAIESGIPFWDLVTSTLTLPVPVQKHGEQGQELKGALVLCGVERTVGPDEPERWLGLLSSWLEERLCTLRKDLIFMLEHGQVPAYVEKMLSAPLSLSFPVHIMSLTFRRGEILSKYNDVIGLAKRFFNACTGSLVRLELCGLSPCDVWLCLYGIESESAAESALKRIAKFRPFKQLGLSEARLFTVKDNDLTCNDSAEGAVSKIRQFLHTSSLIGMPFLTARRLQEIERRFGCSGFYHPLLEAAGASLPRSFAAAFAVCEKDFETEPAKFYSDMIFKSPDGKCMLFIRRVPFAMRDDFDLSSWGKDVRQAVKRALSEGQSIRVPVGVAASWQPTLKARTAPSDSFWAYVHAYMLGAGDAVAFDHVTWQVRGDELLSSGALQHACRAYRNALEFSGAGADILNSLGVALVQAGRMSEAESAFRQAAEKAPDDFMAFYNLCGIQHRAFRLDEAKQSCRRAVELSPDEVAALTRLSHVLIDAGEDDKAVPLLEKALERASERGLGPLPAVWRLLGIARYRQGEWIDAKGYLEKCIKARPDDLSARAWLAMGYAEHERDCATAGRLSSGISAKLGRNHSSKGAMRPRHGSRTSGLVPASDIMTDDINAVLSRLRALIAQSSLDKEMADG